MNRKVIVGASALAVFATIAVLNLKSTMAPYVSFAEAREATGAVQIGGHPDHGGARFDMEKGLFLFTMTDDAGDHISVSYAGAKPGNFDQAEKVVVVGKYHEGQLQAGQILVKCPSKYQDESNLDLVDDPAEAS